MKQNKKTDYSKIWLAFVQIVAKKGLVLEDLVESNGVDDNFRAKGAWTNIMIKAKTIHEALDIAPKGIDEKGFEIKFIDKIENFQSLVEYEEVTKDFIEEADWLLNSKFVFKIAGSLHLYK